MLKVQITPKRFLASLKAVAAFAARSGPKAILQSIQMEATQGGRLLLRATDLEAFVVLKLEYHKVLRPGTVQVPKDRILPLLAEARGTPVLIEEIEPEKLPLTPEPSALTRKIVVRSVRSRTTLPTFDPAHFPVLAAEPTTGSVTLPAWRLLQLIKRTQFVSDPSSTRYALGGPAFEFRGGALELAATDGHCLASASEPATGTRLEPVTEITVDDETRCVAPAVAARPLKALAGILLGRETKVELGFTATGRLLVRGSGLVFSARQLPGRFPCWREDIPDPPRAAFQVDDPAGFQKALKETARLLVPGQRNMSLRLHRYLLTLAVDNDEASTTREIPVRNLSEDIERAASLVIDPAYLLPYLAAQCGPFAFAFPPAPGLPLCCLSEGWRFLVQPKPQEEDAAAAAPDTDEHEVWTSPEPEALTA